MTKWLKEKIAKDNSLFLLMKSQKVGHFFNKLLNKKDHYPWSGQIEFTYRCGLNCVHCYSKYHAARYRLHVTRREQKNKELSTEEWKKILDEIQKEGCLYLTFTGGDPLIREDFLELYSYAKRKGFIITIFTNGEAFRDEIVDYLTKSPPFSIEITLNGITKDTYERITQVGGSFKRVVETIKELDKRGLRLILKANCLKENKGEIAKIKKWTQETLGKPSENKYRFKYDPMIYPRLDGDRTPCNHRLSFAEMIELRRQDADIWQEYQKGLEADFPDLKRDRSFLYRCTAWFEQFFINPYGRLKFCLFTEKFSVDLKAISFKEGFYSVFPQALKERFKTDSKCKDCRLRPICYNCPARAYLETGDEEAPVEYYCELAENMVKEKKRYFC